VSGNDVSAGGRGVRLIMPLSAAELVVGRRVCGWSVLRQGGMGMSSQDDGRLPFVIQNGSRPLAQSDDCKEELALGMQTHPEGRAVRVSKSWAAELLSKEMSDAHDRSIPRALSALDPYS
jgi:hypothetical protein